MRRATHGVILDAMIDHFVRSRHDPDKAARAGVEVLADLAAQGYSVPVIRAQTMYDLGRMAVQITQESGLPILRDAISRFNAGCVRAGR